MNSEKKQAFIVDFFKKLKSSKSYCILRNYDKLPFENGDDIDMLVDDSADDVVERVILPIISELGWQYHIKFRKEGFTPILCLYTTSNSVDVLQLDIYTKFVWRGNKFVDEKAILESSFLFNDYCVAGKGADAAVTVIKELIGSESIRKKYHERLPLYLTEDKEGFYKTLSSIYPVNLIDDIVNDIGHSRFDALKKKAKAIKKTVKRQNKSVYWNRSFAAFKHRKADKQFFRGKLIAFVGPDGSGKTTLINNESELLERFFPHNVTIFHRRYEIFKELKTGHGLSSMKGEYVSGKSEMTEQKKSNKKKKRSFISKLASWFVVFYYTLEYMVGNRKATKLMNNRSLILYDRYYYDHFVQPTTRDLIYPSRKFLLSLVKKPDLIIHLIASGDVIYQRKQDLDKEEIDIQNMYMTRILKDCKNVKDVYTDNLNANEVMAEVFRIVIENFYGIKLKKN